MPLEPIKTPCIGVCRMDERLGICIGCGRDRIMIAGWAMMTDEERDWYMIEAANTLKDGQNNEMPKL